MDAQLLIIILAVVGAVLPFLWKFIDSKIAQVKKEKLRAALEEISDAAEAAVEAALETTVKEAKKDPDGKLDKEDAKKIKEAVVNSTIKSASKTTTKVLMKNFKDDDLKERVGNLVEVSLRRIKERRNRKK